MPSRKWIKVIEGEERQPEARLRVCPSLVHQVGLY